MREQIDFVKAQKNNKFYWSPFYQHLILFAAAPGEPVASREMNAVLYFPVLPSGTKIPYVLKQAKQYAGFCLL